MLQKRQALALLAIVLAGCGGRNHDDSPTPIPLSSYGDVTTRNVENFNGFVGTSSFSPIESNVQETPLVIDTPHGSGTEGTRRVEITVANPSTAKGTRYPLSQSGPTVLRFYDTAGGKNRVWISTGGTLVVDGKDLRRLKVRLVNVAIAPAPDTDAQGTATLNGSFHLDYPLD